MSLLQLIRCFVLPAAFDLLPVKMRDPGAAAMLLAIGLQESRFTARRQALASGKPGPAVGFWQFEVAGVEAVLDHAETQLPIAQALSDLRYNHTLAPALVHPLLEHNDVVAACFARCLLWASPIPLPAPDDPGGGWDLYRHAWRPGRPRRSTWNTFFEEAWAQVDATPTVTPTLAKAGRTL
jgi:hypothetical protein